MRIGFDARLIGFSGAGVYTYNLLRNLLHIDSNNNYLIFTDRFTRDSTPVPPNAKNSRILSINASPLTLKHHFSFFSVFLTEQLDVYHYPHFDMPLGQRYPSVVTVHDLHPISIAGYCSREKQYYFRLIVKLNLLRARKVIAVSEHTKREILENFPVDEGKIEVIHEGVDESFKNTAGISSELAKRGFGLENDFILYVGNHKPHKNLVALLDAYARLDQNIQRTYDLIITGRMEESDMYLFQAVERLGLKNRVKFIGFVDQKSLPGLYKSATALVMPSLKEGFGLPVLEAMTCGTPVVAANTSALPEVAGDACVFFDPYEIDEMVAAISKVLQDEELRSRLSRLGKERAESFSWRESARRTLQVYEEVARESTAS